MTTTDSTAGLGGAATPMPTPARTDDGASEAMYSPAKGVGLIGWCSIAWLVVVGAMAIAPDVFPVADVDHRFRTPITSDNFDPRVGHWLGFDSNGFDLTSKVVYGTRASMIVSAGAISLALLVGGSLGLIAGYFRGRIDGVLTTAFNVMLAIPTIVLALTLAVVLAPPGPDITYARRIAVVTVAIGLAATPILGRITRASTLAWSERDFVIAARVLGMRPGRILRREVLPNVLPTMYSIALLSIAVAIVAEGGLALLGVGVPAGIDTPSWGNLIATGRTQMLLGKPWMVLAPSMAIFLTVFSLNYVGDLIRARLDIRESFL